MEFTHGCNYIWYAWKNENMRWNCILIRMNLMNEKDTMDEIGNMDVFGHMDGMTFMDEIDQHPYILIWLTRSNVTILSDQIHQLKLFHPCHSIDIINIVC